MAKMSSLKESWLLSVIKIAAVIFRALPFRVSLWIARGVGTVGYYVSVKKRRVVYGNLKTVFAPCKSPVEIRAITKKVFVNYCQSFVEILCLPKMQRLGFEHFVGLENREIALRALSKGKGLILLAVHTGNWELASALSSSIGHAYNMVANQHSKTPRIDALLNKYRAVSGGKVIPTNGLTIRNIIRALRNNEIVTLVLDQGGSDGVVVKFMGKTASLSSGAIRLGIKYGVPVCPVWMKRVGVAKQVLTYFEPLDLSAYKDTAKDNLEAMDRAATIFGQKIQEYPDEYMWFYRVFKYSDESHVVILDDGKAGHLRQSQATAQLLRSVLNQRGKRVVEQTIRVAFQSSSKQKWFSVLAFLSQAFGFLCREELLAFFLTPTSYQELIKVRPDFVIACGSMVGSVNFFIKRCYNTKAICLLKPGPIAWKYFDLVIAPEHDRPSVFKTKFALTKAALNLVTPEYLKNQSALLLNRYSHLKNSVRMKIGVLLGGNTRGVVYNENQIRLLLRQIKEAASHFNADILITTSRRTPAAVDAVVSKEMRSFERCVLCIIANDYNVPEAVGGILALSDLLIVSGDSISMVSEAVTSGKRTIVFRPSGHFDQQRPGRKYDRFVLGLNAGGYLLACTVKDLSMTIHNMMTNKFAFKSLADQPTVRQAVEEIV